MSWITEHKNVWRAAILVVALVAIMGPWIHDRIFVPSDYTCSAPNVRLDENFCGIPLTGVWLFRMMVDVIVYASVGLVTGTMALGEWAREFLYSLVLFLLLLPLFSSLLLILRGDRRRRQVFNIAAWVLAAGIGLLLGIFNYPNKFWLLWGLWTFIGLAIIALILEVLTLRRQEA